jgi:LPXTG-site transpeptidase (sortase) family protein
MAQWRTVVVAGVITGTVLSAIAGRDRQEQRAEPEPTRAAAVTPRRLDIPSLKLKAPLMRLGLTAEGDVELPPFDKPQVAGWYEGSAVPGEKGASVIIGHVDTKTAAAVFYRLREVRKGAEVRITRSDGKVARYRVEKIEQVPKERFPAERVYTEDGLRLVTCGGVFDRSRGQYRDNIIVYASRVT